VGAKTLCSAILFGIFALVLLLPFKVRRIEENIEPFFLGMGILALTVSHLLSGITGWSREIVEEALKAPVSIHHIPIGIFQIVLIFGLLIYFFHKPFYRKISQLLGKLGFRLFFFLLILILGLCSSIISVIVSAVIISEIFAAFALRRDHLIKAVVITCFAVGLGAALTPLGEPLSTIAVSKLSGPPYHAGFTFLLEHLGIYIIPGVVGLSIFGSVYLGRMARGGEEKLELAEYTETLSNVVWRAVKVYLFIAGLILLGEGMKPIVEWYLSKIPAPGLFWVNTISAVLDNATLTAVEIEPTLTLPQIKSALMGLLISGGILIPGNIPNIVSAGRLKIKSKEWARVGAPIGLVLLLIYFLILHVAGLH